MAGDDGNRNSLQEKMKKVMDTVINFKDGDGRRLSDPFMELPSIDEYPDYYEIIENPVDIARILVNITSGAYLTLDDLEREFMQLCTNAQFYNEEESLIFEDSTVLQAVFMEARGRLEHETATAATEPEADVHRPSDSET